MGSAIKNPRHTMKPGYAFKCDTYARRYPYIPDEAWDTVVVSEDLCERVRWLGSLLIDGIDCAIFVDADGTHFAQTKVFTRNS